MAEWGWYERVREFVIGNFGKNANDIELLRELLKLRGTPGTRDGRDFFESVGEEVEPPVRLGAFISGNFIGEYTDGGFVEPIAMKLYKELIDRRAIAAAGGVRS